MYSNFTKIQQENIARSRDHARSKKGAPGTTIAGKEKQREIRCDQTRSKKGAPGTIAAKVKLVARMSRWQNSDVLSYKVSSREITHHFLLSGIAEQDLELSKSPAFKASLCLETE